MSDNDRWDETRRIEPDPTRPGANRPRPEDPEPVFTPAEDTRRIRPDHTDSHGTQQLDAVGDSTYDDPYGDTYSDPYVGQTGSHAAVEEEPDGREPAEPPKQDRWRTALLLLLGIGLGFIAALIVVALFGGDATGDDQAALRGDRIAELEEQVQTLEQENSEMEATIEQRDDQIADLQSGLDDAQTDTQQRQQELDDREISLDQREQQQDDRQQQQDDREQQLDEREQAIEQRESDSDAEPPPESGGNGNGNGSSLPDLPDIDGDDADAFIDRVIEGIRDLFR